MALQNPSCRKERKKNKAGTQVPFFFQHLEAKGLILWRENKAKFKSSTHTTTTLITSVTSGLRAALKTSAIGIK